MTDVALVSVLRLDATSESLPHLRTKSQVLYSVLTNPNRNTKNGLLRARPGVVKVGIEPTTYCTTNNYSTNELHNRSSPTTEHPDVEHKYTQYIYANYWQGLHTSGLVVSLSPRCILRNFA